MPIRAFALAVLLLASLPANVAAQASALDHLAAMEAPVGHRQPTLNDLPSWLRKQETGRSGRRQTEGAGSGTDGMQRREQDPNGANRPPTRPPYTGVPQICQGC